LSRCFDRIGIWPLLADEIASCSEMRRGIRAMAQHLDGQIGSEYGAYLGEEPRAYAHLHFIHWVLNLESVEFHRFDAPDEFPEPGPTPQRAVIAADLESLPVPLSPTQLDDHALELMLFAATCQVSADYPLKQGFPWFSWHCPSTYNSDAQQNAVEGLVKAAIADFPNYAFSP
jgi:hypothetical protein